MIDTLDPHGEKARARLGLGGRGRRDRLRVRHHEHVQHIALGGGRGARGLRGGGADPLKVDDGAPPSLRAVEQGLGVESRGVLGGGGGSEVGPGGEGALGGGEGRLLETNVYDHMSHIKTVLIAL